MSWVLASMLMFCCSVLLYTAMRKGSLIHMHSAYVNLSNFLPSLVLYIIAAIVTGTSVMVTSYQLFLLVISGVFFSYFGSVFSIKSLAIAPNPGYPLTLSKSYVVFTSLAAVLLFRSPLPLSSILAIAIIVGFSAVIMVDKKKKGIKTDRRWIMYAMISFFCWGMLSLTTKYLLTLGVPVLTRLIYISAIVSAIQGFELIVKRNQIDRMNGNHFLLFILIGLAATGFNYFQIVAIDLAPNVGFVNAINASSIAVVAMTAHFAFGDKVTLKKAIGIGGVLVGLFILIFAPV